MKSAFQVVHCRMNCSLTSRITVFKRKAKKKADKDKGDRENDDETVADESSVAADSDEEEQSLVAVEFSRFREHLRELDFDVCLILTLPLTLTHETPKVYFLERRIRL